MNNACCGNCDDCDCGDKVEVINSFSGQYEFLSNFYDCIQSSDIVYIDENDDAIFIKDTFRTVEHAFQASKTMIRSEQIEIRDAVSAKQAKRLGNRAQLRENWDDKRITIMDRLVRDKFFQNFELKMKLINLEDKELIEGNTWKDTFWGQDQNGIGENNLGKILMSIRDEIIRNQGGFEDQVREFLMRHQLKFVADMIQFNR